MSLARVLRLAVIFGIALHVTDGRAEFDVGRVKLRLSEDAWESVGTTRRTVPYTGDRSGEIPYVTRYLVLRNEAGKFRAALVVGASWGVGSVRMTWLQNCRSQQYVYAIDNARGNLNLRDCLRVTGRISPQRYLETTAREMLPELSARNVALPAAGYAVSEEIGLENGTYLVVQAIFADDFKLPTDASGRAAIPPDVKSEAVAWGERLADAVRSCARSLSGALVVPAVVTQTN